MTPPRQKREEVSGFTLLEVVVALTIVGLAVGSLFGLIGGVKRLAWNSGDALIRSVTQRAAINSAQLQNEPELYNYEDNAEWSLTVESGEELERPERQTVAMPFALENYTIKDKSGRIVQQGVRWVELDLAKM